MKGLAKWSTQQKTYTGRTTKCLYTYTYVCTYVTKKYENQNAYY